MSRCSFPTLRAPLWLSLLPLFLLQAPSIAPAVVHAAMSEPAAASGAAIRDEIVSTAAQIAGASKSLAQIWPGYWPEDQAFIIHAEGVGALLVSPGARPQSFKPMPDKDLPEPLKGRAYFQSGTLAGASRPFVINYPIGEGKTALLANRNPTDPVRTITLILHEQFHGYQELAFKGRQPQFVDPLAIKDRIAFAASAEVERSILAAAVSAPTAGGRRELLKQYFAVRREREQTMPQDAFKVEQGFERSEGTAQFVDMTARAAIAGGGEKHLLGLLNEQLQRKLAAETGAFATIWFRSRGYGTGAALTYLISKSGTPSWRAEIEAGGKLDEMLENSIGTVPDKGRRKLADAALKRFGYEAKTRDLAPIIKAAERSELKSVAEFLALSPYHVILEPGAAGASARPGFQAREMTMLSPQTTALPMAIRFSAAGESFSITLANAAVLLESGQPRRYTFGLNSAPAIEGAGSLPAGEHRLKALKLTGDKFELKVDRPVIVRVESNRMVVKLDQ